MENSGFRPLVWGLLLNKRISESITPDEIRGFRPLVWGLLLN